MMGGRTVAPPLVLALVTIIAIAAAEGDEVKCGGCSPCGGADCPVLYPSPPPPPYYYYSPPPPATYPGESSSYYQPPPPGAYIQIGSAPPGKGPLYPQDPGFIPAGAPGRAAPLAVVAALAAALACAWAFL
jgi:hypothetical protein